MESEKIKKLELLDRIKSSFFEHKLKLIEEILEELPYDLTVTKYYILKYIAKAQHRMVVDIASRMKLTSGATTTLLNQLEKVELICRKRDTQDKRVVWISLTEQGEELVNKLQKQQHLFWNDILSALTQEEQQQYFSILEKIENKINDKV